MADDISIYLAVDTNNPSIPKPSLQQYDNYQIHDLYCDDIVYQPSVLNYQPVLPPQPVLFKNFLAVEAYSPHGVIDCDFDAIAITYP